MIFCPGCHACEGQSRVVARALMVRLFKRTAPKLNPHQNRRHSSSAISLDMSPRRGTISNLPNELLVRIFTLVQLLCEEDAETDPMRTPAQNDCVWAQWLIPARVCRHWYAVIVGCPALWTTIRQICLHSPYVLETILARSNGLPLTVDVDDISNPITRTILLRQMRRIRNLTLEVLRTELDEHRRTVRDLHPDLYRPDILETLELHITDNYDDDSYQPFSLSEIFHGEFPRLREFILYCLNADMDGNVPAPNLQSLFITMSDDIIEELGPPHRQPKYCINIRNLMASLREMPLLSWLGLLDPCSTTLQAVDESDGTASLQSLKHVYLQTSAGGAVPLLRRISLPPTCQQVQIRLDRAIGPPSDLTSLVTALGIFLGRLSRDSSSPEPFGLLVAGSASTTSFEFHLPITPSGDRPIPLSVVVCGYDREDTPHWECAVKLLAIMPFAPNVTSVSLCSSYVDEEPVLSPDVQRRLFQKLARYREVRRLDIFPGSLPLPVSTEEVREVFPLVREATYPDSDGESVWERTEGYTYAMLPTEGLQP